MLTGGFVLADERNRDWKFFYSKAVKNILIPTIVFSVAYFLYSFLKHLIRLKVGIGTTSDVLKTITDLFRGAPFYHLWYMYMLIGIYLLIPFIVRFRILVGEKSFCKFAMIFLLFAGMSEWTSEHTVNWDVGMAFCCSGYVMAGYVVKKHFNQKKSNIRGVCFLILSLILLSGTGILKMIVDKQLFRLPLSDFDYIDTMSPLIIISSVLMFSAFSCFDISKNFSKLSSLTLYIYLFHAVIVDLTTTVLRKVFANDTNHIITAILIILFVFTVSATLSLAYKRLWKVFDKKCLVSEKLCKFLRLS